jgi:two-component system CheB/CheR fusion protein
MMDSNFRQTGIEAVGLAPWGSHFCQLYTTKRDLVDTLVPYFKAGLKSDEFCLWVTSPPLGTREAWDSLSTAVPDLDSYRRLGRIEIIPHTELHLMAGTFDRERVLRLLIDKIERALATGCEGMRLSGDTFWLEESDWRGFADYKAMIDDGLGQHRLMTLCAYSLEHCGVSRMPDFIHSHRFALLKRDGAWDRLERRERESTSAEHARQALLESEERYRLLFGNLCEGVVICEMIYDDAGKPYDYRFLEMNPTFERLSGLRRDLAVGRTVLDVWPDDVWPDNDRFWLEKYAEVVATGIPARIERQKEVHGRSYEVLAFRPRPGQFALLLLDATDRRRAEEALRQKERAFKEAQRLAHLGSWDWNMSTDTYTMSDELVHIFGRSWPSFQEQRATIYPPESWHLLDAAMQRALQTGEGYQLDLEALRADGVAFWITTRGEVVRDARGMIVGLCGTVQDITERKRLERLYAVLSRVNEAIVRVHDEATLYQEVCRILAQEGRFPLVWIGLTEADVVAPVASFGPSVDYLTEIEVQVQGTLGEGPTGRCVRENRPVVNDDFDTNVDTVPWREHALKRNFRASAAFPLHRRGQPVGALTLYAARPGGFDPEHVRLLQTLSEDLSSALDAMEQERLRATAEDALRESERNLQEVDQRKNEFMAILSHELRNPLAPITNSLYVLKHAAAGGEQARRAQSVIERQVGQLSRLVDDLLDITRISRNKVHLQRKRLELNELVRHTMDDYRELFERSEILLELHAHPSPVFVNGDWNRLAQVVGNLLQNATKFTGKGGRTSVSVGTDAVADRAIVRVKDSGVGMLPETLARLFQPFVQAQNTLDRSKGGLGLGLALVKGLVDLHGGEISAESAGLGRGAELILRLPLDPDRTPEITKNPVFHQQRRRVLIIEDNLDAADTLGEALEIGGHEVVIAHSGAEGIAKAREVLPEVVLCDIGLPGMDGFEVARTLRADHALEGTFLVALSGYALPEDLERASAAGFDRHLAKPLRLEELKEILSNLRS